ncbi:MAG: hypothetical protein V3T11_09965 [Roseateles sp.]
MLIELYGHAKVMAVIIPMFLIWLAYRRMEHQEYMDDLSIRQERSDALTSHLKEHTEKGVFVEACHNCRWARKEGLIRWSSMREVR